jgi:hypothetical protein
MVFNATFKNISVILMEETGEKSLTNFITIFSPQENLEPY